MGHLLDRALAAEAAAVALHAALTPEERAAYRAAHPRTLMGLGAAKPRVPKGMQRIGDGTLVPDDSIDCEPGELKHLRKTTVPLSHWSVTQVNGRHEYHVESPDREVMVEPSRLRATQHWIDTRWKPEEDPESPASGVRDSRGLVHLRDGHHRAEDALRRGVPLEVHVKDHTDRHEGNPRFKRHLRDRWDVD